MQHPGKGITWVHPGLLWGRWCSSGLHHIRAADGHSVSFGLVSKGEKPESSFTLGGKERAPSAAMFCWHKVGCRLPGSPPSQFWSNPKAAERGPVATPSGQATDCAGLGLDLPYAQSLVEHQCAGGLQKILAMQHHSLGRREVWGKKAKTLDSGCLMLRPCARWGSSTCRACYPPKLNNLNCAIKYFYQICF